MAQGHLSRGATHDKCSQRTTCHASKVGHTDPMRVGMQKWAAAFVVAVIVIVIVVVVAVFVSTSLGTDDDTAASSQDAAAPSADAEEDRGENDVAIGLDDFDSGLPACDFNNLPATSLNVINDIEDGGPFDYPPNDGGTFGNYEGILPGESNGYYREYTVATPGLNHRGSRRIVTGGFDEDNPDEWFFTSDHYDSFCEFAPAP